GDSGRIHRHGRALLSARSAAHGAVDERGGDGGAGAFIHAHLSSDGSRAGDQAPRPFFGERKMTPAFNLRTAVIVALVAALLLLPVYAELAGNRFVLTLFTRIIILALAAAALFALVIGALSLRTRGVYFIMITLAFAQMAYYVCAGMARYGGDD